MSSHSHHLALHWVITVTGDGDHRGVITGRGWWRDARVRERARAHGGGEGAAGADGAARVGCPLCADDPAGKKAALSGH